MPLFPFRSSYPVLSFLRSSPRCVSSVQYRFFNSGPRPCVMRLLYRHFAPQFAHDGISCRALTDSGFSDPPQTPWPRLRPKSARAPPTSAGVPQEPPQRRPHKPPEPRFAFLVRRIDVAPPSSQYRLEMTSASRTRSFPRTLGRPAGLLTR